MIEIIDTFLDYRDCFRDKLDAPIDEKIDLWEKRYMIKYPELEAKCKNDYENCGYSWRDIAVNMVFNRTKADFNKMLEAYNNINRSLKDINHKVHQVFEIEPSLYIVLYCGLCNSAGWVDTYNGNRAILFGIDKIAELGWHTEEKIKPLIAHELCHVIHFEIRGEDELTAVEANNYNKGIWRIYEEGFAQYYQQKLAGDSIDSRGEEWIKICNENQYKLKNLYLKALSDEKAGTKNFFGDWFKVIGISDAGYFLGAELIKRLNETYNIQEIAKLEFKAIEKEVINFLNE